MKYIGTTLQSGGSVGSRANESLQLALNCRNADGSQLALTVTNNPWQLSFELS